MSQQITIYQYLAWSDDQTKQDIIDMIRSKGYQINPRSEQDLANNIAGFVDHEGEAGLDALALLHPDRDLILRNSKHSLKADGDLSPLPVPAAPLPVKNIDQSSTINSPVVLGLVALVTLGIVGMVIAKK